MSTQAHLPDGAGPRPHLTRPCPELIDSWLGDAGLGDPTGERRVEATRHFRDVLGRFASGVTVVTAMGADGPVGLTCQSFTSVSLDPPLVLFVPSRTSRSWPWIRAAGTFCVNFLSDGQEELANTMASRGADKFAGADFSPSPQTGSPVLAGVLGYVDCLVQDVHEAGDHDVVIGRVVDLQLTTTPGEPELPLLFYRGAYATTD